MSEIRVARVEQGQTKIKNVPIAVTPEGFWCCPSPAVFQKTVKTQNPLNKPKPSSLSTPQTSSLHKKQTSESQKQQPVTSVPPKPNPCNEEPKNHHNRDSDVVKTPSSNEETTKPKPDNVPRKVTIEFGEPGTSDLKVVLLGKQGVSVKLSVHRTVLVQNSRIFSDKIVENQPIFPFLEIEDCEDIEIYVETIGLMYSCKESMKPKLIKQSVPRVLRILKAAEKLGFTTCIESCLEYLEAVPWVGEEEEEKVVSLVSSLKGDANVEYEIKPVLKRISSNAPNPSKDTLSHILDLVLKSSDEKSRREMKSVVVKLLRENNNSNNNTLLLLPNSSSNSSSDSCIVATIYNSCTSSLSSLLSLFRQASNENPESSDQKSIAIRKSIALEADNLTWLFDILADKQAAEEFARTWADQQELASLHETLPIVIRHHVSVITSRIFVRIGRGELLPCKDTRHSLLKRWLQPLMNDYGWLQHSSRSSFDRKVVEEGIGRTILTLPLEDQQSFMLSWLGCFLKGGDSCPNLQKAFEVWWRRTFVRPFTEC